MLKQLKAKGLDAVKKDNPLFKLGKDPYRK